MAEIIAFGASVLAFIGLADRVIHVSKCCIDAVQDAPSDFRMIHGEVSSLRDIVDGLTEKEKLALLVKKNGLLEACHRCLSDLAGLLPPDPPSQGHRRLPIAELAWSLKQTKTRKLLAELSQHKATLLLVISGDILSELHSIKTNIQEVQINISDSERRAIHLWMERTNPSPLHNAALSKHEPHTCAWLTRSAEWKDWVSSKSPDRMLWIHGIPGAGKTVLASFAIEELTLLCEVEDEHVTGSDLVYYYCHYSNNQDESIPFLSWVTSQVCRQLRWVPPRLKRLHDRGCEPTISELQHILELALARLDKLFIVVDAVDESKPRDELVRLLATITLDSRFQKVRILATSRKYWDIERFFSGISTCVSMKNPYVDADIERHILTRLNSDFRLQRWRDSFQGIKEVLVAKANGMFRWVDCQLHNIGRLGDKTRLVSVLQDLPQDLSETYVRIFSAIPENDRQFVTRVLVWVYGDSVAPWPVDRGINAKLLLEAVTFELYGSVSACGSRVFDLDYLQDLCGCLIAIANHPKQSVLTGDESTDGANCYITLAHYTVWEFLTSEHILSTPVSHFEMSTTAVHRDYATSILRQAITADPEGTETDWRRDRIPYCLVLGCALKSAKYLQTREDLDLIFEFLDPRRPHYRRFRGVQQRTCEPAADDEWAFQFSVLHIPAGFCVPKDSHERNHLAELLLNARLLSDWIPREAAPYKGLPPVGGLSQQELKELAEEQVAGVFIRSNGDGGTMEVKFAGKVRSCMSPPRLMNEERLNDYTNRLLFESGDFD